MGGIVLQTLDAMISAAESADHWLHVNLEKLRELRNKLITFGAEGEDADPLVGELRALGDEAT